MSLAGLALAAAVAGAAAEGLWRTPEGGGGLVRIEACGEALCGVLVASPRLSSHPDQRDVRNPDPGRRGRPLKGLRILEVRGVGPEARGWVYNPQDGRTYRGSLRLEPDGRLRLTGCVAAVLCRTQLWVRVAERAGG